MNKNSKVGIVIPSYERFKYLKEAVKSALNQTYENIEIVIIDDSSNDPAIIEYLDSINNPMVRYFINKANLGTTRNYDAGVRSLSKDVEYCVILDNDDWLDRDFIREAVNTHLKYPRSKVIHGKQIFINAEGKVISSDKGLPLFEDSQDYLFLRCLGEREIRSSSLFFNLERFKKIGGYPQFPSGMCTDSVFIFSLAFDNALVYAEKALVYTRIHEGAESISANNLFEKLASVKQMQSYCTEVYENNRRYSYRSKNRVTKQLRHYAGGLNSALLLRKYREILDTNTTLLAKERLKEVMGFCRENQLSFSHAISASIDFFLYSGIDLDKLIFYRLFIKTIDKIGLIKKGVSYKSFLFRKKIKKHLNAIRPLMYLYRQSNAILNVLFNRNTFRFKGLSYCYSCGCYSFFYWNKDYAQTLGSLIPSWGMDEAYIEQMIKRENEFCANCGGVFRIRAHAKTVLGLLKLSRLSDFISLFKRNPSFTVYEAARYNLFRNEKIKEANNYIVSEFHPEYDFGKDVDGVRNENLESLTFDSESFDILITSEVLEHVSDLSKSLSEIRRVLKYGGYHIFTIPVNYSLNETRQRVILGPDGATRHILPPAFHGDDITDGILAQRDFGRDIDRIMSERGFRQEEEKFYLNGRHITSVYIAKKV